MTTETAISVPYCEDFTPGYEFEAPGVTLTEAHAAIYQSIFGDRLLLPLDHASSAAVTGADKPLAHPLLAVNVAIGQSTWASQRVKANLFYRGLSLLRPVFIGDTLRTRIVALRRNRAQPGRATTGIVGLEIRTCNQHQPPVLHFWRCPMVLCRGDVPVIERTDDLETLGHAATLPPIPDWRFDQMPVLSGGPTTAGTVLRVEARDTVTAAPEFVRLTLNMAMAHTDAGYSHLGARASHSSLARCRVLQCCCRGSAATIWRPWSKAIDCAGSSRFWRTPDAAIWRCSRFRQGASLHAVNLKRSRPSLIGFSPC